MSLSECTSNQVIDFFEKICAIPHGSGNEAALSEYLRQFAVERNLWVIKDAANNVIIKKPASPGYEHAPMVILQAHIDMVCEKNADTEHDFVTDPIRTVIDDDILHACGTTLGADNGIGAAMAMAVLDDDTLDHPALEALFTTDEEVGMIGAESLDGRLLDGRILLNLDTEEEGVFCTSCAGGLKGRIAIRAEYTEIKEDCAPYKIMVRGLKGGHSGLEIHKQHANANILLGRVLDRLHVTYGVRTAAINGGLKDNAIPREAEAVVALDVDMLDDIRSCINEMETVFNKEYSGSESGIRLLVEPVTDKISETFTDEVCKRITSTILLIPNGVQFMSSYIPGLVETSNNLGVIRTSEGYIKFNNALRSSVASRKYQMVDKLRVLCSMTGAELLLEHDYPAWEYKADSNLRHHVIGVYKELTDREPVVSAVHAGLECGLLAKKLEDVDIISFGPDIHGAHTPSERVSISSTNRVYGFLTKVLVSMKNY